MPEATLTFQKNDARVINAWCSYDWANSVYSLTISSAIFPVYYSASTRSAFGGDQVLFFGQAVENTVLYSYALSVSFLVIACCSPLLSGIADYGGMKKKMMKAFTLLGSGSCIALFFFTGKNIEFGVIACTLASIGWAGSIVFYNAYLPEIATPDRFDRISARGFSMGYIGSVIQLIISLVIVMQPAWFGIADDGLAARLSFLFVGIWWIGFAQIAFWFLPGNIHKRTPQDARYLKKGYQELRKVWVAIQQNPPIKRFIPSFFFYNMGVQTVMLLAATFGEKELGLPAGKLIITILLIQLVAIAGAYLFARVSELYGNKLSLLVMIAIWIGICLYAYLVKTDTGFYFLAIVVGMVMGGIQSLSRSTYSKLLPPSTEDTASYFSFFDVTDKISIVAGTFLYGLIEHLTGNMRFSALALACFFLIGLLLMLRFRMQPKVQ